MKKVSLETITAAVKGDQRAWDEIYSTFHRTILNSIWKIVGDVAKAEDLTQETFAKAFNKLHTFQNRSALGTWLYTIGKNTAFMYLRKNPKGNITYVELSVELPDFRAPNPEWLALNRRSLSNAMDKLKERDRRILLFFFIDGYTHQEIAQKLGITANYSKGVLRRAKNRLRTSLVKQGYHQELGETDVSKQESSVHVSAVPDRLL